MEIILPMFQEISLKMATEPAAVEKYPTAKLSKGLILMHAGQELNEEAVGFGVPVLKRGLLTIFPGAINVDHHRTGTASEIQAVFAMNLEERVAGSDQRNLTNRTVYAIKNFLAYLHRQLPVTRGPLTAVSTLMRRAFRWRTTFEEVESSARVRMRYSVQPADGMVAMEAELSDPGNGGITELIVMHEQGGNYFDRYQELGGAVVAGEKIGTWDEVKAREGSFICARHRISFACGQAIGARLFRGRELIGSRVAWSGFGHVFSPQAGRFQCTVSIRKSA